MMTANAGTKITHEQFCEILEQAVSTVDLSDGGQLVRLSDGKIAHFSPMSGEGSILTL